MMLPWRRAEGLNRAGVLGMNGRNGDYIMMCNARKLYPLVDDKLLTKELAQRAGLADARALRRRSATAVKSTARAKCSTNTRTS